MIAGLGVVVARFGVAFVGGELVFGGGAGGVPGFAEGKVALLADDVAGGIGGDARGKMVGVEIVGGDGGGRRGSGGAADGVEGGRGTFVVVFGGDPIGGADDVGDAGFVEIGGGVLHGEGNSKSKAVPSPPFRGTKMRHAAQRKAEESQRRE